jgi:hypothetical protein
VDHGWNIEKNTATGEIRYRLRLQSGVDIHHFLTGILGLCEWCTVINQCKICIAYRLLLVSHPTSDQVNSQNVKWVSISVFHAGQTLNLWISYPMDHGHRYRCKKCEWSRSSRNSNRHHG